MFITTNAGTFICGRDEEDASLTFECSFFAGEGPSSRFTIESLPEFLTQLRPIDPLGGPPHHGIYTCLCGPAGHAFCASCHAWRQ